MNDIISRKIKTGSDPRMLPDYAALRDELSKLSHPARPDVNWRYAEKLCLSLFEQNGVELQTAAWYTLTRTQLAGLAGLNEGLAILEALITHQWGALWPQPVHARMEILSSLSQRLQQRMRTLPLSYSDLHPLYLAEQQLNRMGGVLQRQALKQLSQLDTLRTQMHNSTVRLENSKGASSKGASSDADALQPDVVLPATESNCSGTSVDAQPIIPLAEKTEPDNRVKWVYVAQPAHQPNVDVLAAIPVPEKKCKSFAAGMFTMLVAGAAAVWGWHLLHQPDPLLTQLASSLMPLPATLTPEQRQTLHQQALSPQAFIAATQQQIERLDRLPPDWRIHYSRQLVEQAEALWPEQAKPLAQQWLRQLNAASIPAENLNGWHQGMTTLQNLSDRLNGLDQQKGKYMTVSELKSVVFSAMQSFNQSLPAEEQLRALSENAAGEPLPAAASSQLEMHLKQLTAGYAELKRNASK
ncbi:MULTISPECIES: VasL domain-containing protein [Pantoea]|jgi:type VI secretion system protein VasL|uniref:Type VI secretion system ImpA family N-terminal domain-containing protein n=1 Tax=Pantoea brenneri TaxID=472694 RepID=A0A7Y6TUB3_9GAMM|nr:MULTISPECIES: VasL domain-containing protein [Pantoea]MBZ6397689.1 type VI secretion system ImpA family N-terminal domain-containing protein [Pantoea sp.]MBZ6440838.1 type VI secretion system ImpA family N-terminal domain-containing protein [Pantoea sp.]MDU7866286.1 VasL domain-containing protein [Pantoea sp.]NUY44253.1 type VI secretion system ImpA family N-terminal domain-containing protein [Pantoea brenneri]NUY51759.1 type VI secretion system ImpA family N-terminal domain-containing prot